MSIDSDLVLALIRAADGERRGDRPPRLEGRLPEGCAFIPLTRGRLAVVDADEVEFLMRWRWWEADGYARCARGPMHRLLLAAPKGLVVDHHNGDGLDNRRLNLRLCTQRENILNRRSANRTGFRGVSHVGAGRWRAAISCEGRTEVLGVFADPADAAHAYDARCRALHGAFAMTNFAAA